MQFQAQLPTTCLCHTVLFIMLRTHSCRGLLSSHTSRLSLDLSSARVRHLLRTMWCHVSRVTITCARRSAGAWPRCSPSSGCRCAPPRGTASPAPPAPRAPAPSPGSCQSDRRDLKHLDQSQLTCRPCAAPRHGSAATAGCHPDPDTATLPPACGGASQR